MEAQASVVHHEQVARVWIGVEHPSVEQLIQVGAEQHVGQRGRLRGSVSRFEALAMAHFLHHHVAGDKRLDDVRERDVWLPVQHRSHAAHVLRLVPHVDLGAQKR